MFEVFQNADPHLEDYIIKYCHHVLLNSLLSVLVAFFCIYVFTLTSDIAADYH